MSSALNSATKTQQETGATSDAFVTPLRQQYHPSAPKGWVTVDNVGNIHDSYNVASVVLVSPGLITINWTVPFSDAFYAVIATIEFDNVSTAASTLIAMLQQTTKLAGSCQIACVRLSDFTQVNPALYSVAAFGAQ